MLGRFHTSVKSSLILLQNKIGESDSNELRLVLFNVPLEVAHSEMIISMTTWR